MKITKYKNRKYYANGRYFTLIEIVELLKQGIEIQVINYKNEDVTNETLKQALTKVNFSNEELVAILGA